MALSVPTDQVDAEICQFEEKARLLIHKQLDTPEDIQRLYQEESARIGLQLKNVKDARNRLQGELLAVHYSNVVQQETLEELADLTLEKFWQQESCSINQVLHHIMGNRRLLILNGELIGVAEVHRGQRRRR
jgi:hypothetical protein